MRILVVEDDPRLAGTLAKGLREQSYAVDIAPDGDRGVQLAVLNSYDAIVLDVMLPKRDGLEMCRTLRGRGSRVPVLMLTARDTVQDKITGLDAGADDYLTKPFAFGELLARLRALLRRGSELLPSVLTVGDLVVDTRSQTARRAGRLIPLTAKEYALLEFLARHAGRVLGRAEICEHVWDENHDPWSNVLEVNINRLRRKLDAGGAAPLIQTRRGAGYMLAEPVEDASV
ncbi:MAG TPA: response regulator transcription factor [Gemmatimonadaceae bacterium]|nr:response regulator transcription factor [Gemmatimonadaceae bacterium]